MSQVVEHILQEFKQETVQMLLVWHFAVAERLRLPGPALLYAGNRTRCGKTAAGSLARRTRAHSLRHLCNTHADIAPQRLRDGRRVQSCGIARALLASIFFCRCLTILDPSCRDSVAPWLKRRFSLGTLLIALTLVALLLGMIAGST